MGRHRRPVVLTVQAVSTGINPMLRDDWSGGVLPQPNARPPRIDNAQAEIDRRNTIKAQQLRQLGEWLESTAEFKPFKRRM